MGQQSLDPPHAQSEGGKSASRLLVYAGGGLVNRVTRMGIGLVALIPVLGLGGRLLEAVGLEGEAAAWVMFGVAAVWIALMIWWALRAPVPAQLSDESRGRYFAFLRQAEYRPLDDSDEHTRTDRGQP